MRFNVIDWMVNKDFNEYLRKVGEFGSLKSINAGRRWMVFQLIRLTKNVPGDTAECGVYKGATSYITAAFLENSATAKHHYLFDSFEGLSTPDEKDGAYWKEHDLTVDQSIALELLARFKNVKAYKGWIPDRFAEVADRQFSFVHIDVDLYQPTHDSIEFFYPRLNEGGILLCDDYGSGFCPGATAAIDEFLRNRPEKMIALTDGAGFFIKGTQTSDNFALS